MIGLRQMARYRVVLEQNAILAIKTSSNHTGLSILDITLAARCRYGRQGANPTGTCKLGLFCQNINNYNL